MSSATVGPCTLTQQLASAGSTTVYAGQSAGQFGDAGPARDEGQTAHQERGGQQDTAPCRIIVAPVQALAAPPEEINRHIRTMQRQATPRGAAVRGFGEAEGRFFVATETPGGRALRATISEHKTQGTTVGLQTAYAILGHVAHALAASGLQIHGAFRPETIHAAANGSIALEYCGLPQILPDIARLSYVNGPSPYCAPEIQAGSAVSVAGDVYALAAIFCELVTGHPPNGLTPDAGPHLAGLTPQLTAVVRRALDARPESRQGSVNAFVKQLSSALSGQSGEPADVSSSVSAEQSARTFSVTEAAGLDGASERWLVQKGRLDYGPFSMNALKEEIQKGHFGSSDYILDTESGERVQIGKHTHLGSFVKGAERSLETARRAQAEASLESVEKKKRRTLIWITSAAAVVLSTLLVIYLMGRQADDAEKLASRAGEEEIDKFMKKFEISFPKNKKKGAKRKRPAVPGGGPRSARDDGAFSTTTYLGDASKGGGDATLREDDIQRTMMRHYRKLVPCVMQARKTTPTLSTINMEFAIQGSGKVLATRVNGDRTGPLAACIDGKMKTFSFPSFRGRKTIASWSMSIR